MTDTAIQKAREALRSALWGYAAIELDDTTLDAVLSALPGAGEPVAVWQARDLDGNWIDAPSKAAAYGSLNDGTATAVRSHIASPPPPSPPDGERLVGHKKSAGNCEYNRAVDAQNAAPPDGEYGELDRALGELRRELNDAPNEGFARLRLSNLLPEVLTVLAAIEALQARVRELEQACRDGNEAIEAFKFGMAQQSELREAAESALADERERVERAEASLAEARRHLTAVLDNIAEATVKVNRRRKARAFLANQSPAEEKGTTFPKLKSAGVAGAVLIGREKLSPTPDVVGSIVKWCKDKAAEHHRIAADDESVRKTHLALASAYITVAENLERGDYRKGGTDGR